MWGQELSSSFSNMSLSPLYQPHGIFHALLPIEKGGKVKGEEREG